MNKINIKNKYELLISDYGVCFEDTGREHIKVFYDLGGSGPRWEILVTREEYLNMDWMNYSVEDLIEDIDNKQN